MTPDTEQQLIHELKQVNTNYQKIHQALCGYEGQEGLIQSHEKLKRDYYDFKRKMLMVLAFALGSGALGISIWQLLA